MWQRSVPSNPTTPTHQHNSRVEDSPSDLPGLLEEETLDFQAEYPREVVEEVEEAEVVEEAEEAVSLPQHSKQLPMEETNLLAIRDLYSQGIAQNQRRS